MKKFILILVAVASILGGCANYRQIQINDAELGKFRIVALNAAEADIKLQINNPTKATFEIAGVDLVISNGKSEFMKITQVKREAVLVTPGTPTQAKITLRGELTDPLAALAQGFNPQSWDLNKLTASGSMTFRKGKMYKTIKVEEVSLAILAGYFQK